MDSNNEPRQGNARHRTRLACVLLVAMISFASGIGWGLPQATSPETTQSWALDTIAPIAPLNEAYYGYTRAGNEYVVYPLFHYVVLGMAYSPYIGAQYLSGNLKSPSSTFPYGLANVAAFCQDLTLIARFVSMVMALLIILLVYRITRDQVGPNAALWAALATALLAPLAYYAKTSNLDVPYTFWVCLAAWRFLAILESQLRRDYVLLGMFAALAVATKDQAYGFFVLLPFALAWAQMQSGKASVKRFLSCLISTPMLMGGAAAVVAYGAANNVFFGGLDGLIRHLNWGGELFDHRQDAADSFYAIGTQLKLAGRTALILLQMFGPATLALAGYGIFLALRERRWKLLSLLLFTVSYYATVVAVFNIVFSRYLLVSAVLLTPFFGLAVERILGATKQRVLVGALVVVAAILPQAALVTNLNLTLAADSRIAMSKWIHANVAPGSVIESQVRERMLPHISPDYDVRIAGNSGDAITMATIAAELTPAALRDRAPDYVLVLEGLGVTGDPAGWDDPALVSYYDELVSGRLGYEEVTRFETPHFVPWQQIPGTMPTSILFARQTSVSDTTDP